MIVFLVTLGVAVFGQILFRGFLSVIPILIAIIAGYAAAGFCGILDFTAVKEASFFALPNFQAPSFNIEAILTILPKRFFWLPQSILVIRSLPVKL